MLNANRTLFERRNRQAFGQPAVAVPLWFPSDVRAAEGVHDCVAPEALDHRAPVGNRYSWEHALGRFLSA